jgi:predicted RNase H-like HicB family nuclease
VRYEREGDWWLASVPALPGCHTQGQSIDQARERIREAIAAWLDDDQTSFDITEDQ